MRRTVLYALTLTAALGVALPAWAGEPKHYPRGERERRHDEGPAPGGLEQGQFRLRIGFFTPRGNSDLWESNAQIFTGKAEDFRDVTFGGDMLWSINRNASVMFSLSTYEGQQLQSDRDFTDENGGSITHNSRLSITPLTVGFVLYPAGRKAPVVPYLGAGAGFYFWRYREAGDFVNTDTLEVFTDRYESSGVAPGAFAVAGLDVPVRPNWSVFLEGRYHWAKGNLGGDFEPLSKIDLSGPEFSAGVGWKF
jgi:opacity protein-like surface antigen